MPKDVIIVLTVSNISMIATTVLSRCQLVRVPSQLDGLDSIEFETIGAEFLKNRDVYSIDDLGFLSLSRLEQMRVIDYLILYFRDMLTRKFSSNDNASINKTSSALDESIDLYTPESIISLIEALGRAKELVSSNINSKLIATSISQQIVNSRAKAAFSS